MDMLHMKLASRVETGSIFRFHTKLVIAPIGDR